MKKPKTLKQYNREYVENKKKARMQHNELKKICKNKSSQEILDLLMSIDVYWNAKSIEKNKKNG